MKCDQIAYYAATQEQEADIKRLLHLDDWVTDTVEGRVWLPQEGVLGRSKALLKFNYTLGMEIEILTYLEGPHWHQDRLLVAPFISHIGYHLDPGEPFPDIEASAPLVQEMWTEKHTNPYVVERGRTYHYRIHDARSILGHYVKFIKRVEKV